MKIYENLWNYWKSIENLWKSMKIYENLWNYWKSIRNLWKPMKIYENLWNYWKSIENIWKPMKIYENVRNSEKIIEMHAPSMQTIGFIHKYIEICKNQWQPMIIHENHWLLYGIYTLQWQTHFNHILITRSAQSSPQAFELKRLEHTSPTTSQESHFLKNVFWLQHFFFIFDENIGVLFFDVHSENPNLMHFGPIFPIFPTHHIFFMHNLFPRLPSKHNITQPV